MQESEVLAYCRKATPAQVVAMLAAITGRMKANDPGCEHLDLASEEIEAADKADAREHAERDAILWADDDEACRRAGVGAAELDSSTDRIPNFIKSAF